MEITAQNRRIKTRIIKIKKAELVYILAQRGRAQKISRAPVKYIKGNKYAEQNFCHKFPK